MSALDPWLYEPSIVCGIARLLDRIHRTDLELELQLKAISRTVERNNETLKETDAKLRSSQEMIQTLHKIIHEKDREIVHLRTILQSFAPDDISLTKEQNPIIPS